MAKSVAVAEAKHALRPVAVPAAKGGRGEFLSTGSTLLNLALTGRTDGGFKKGCYYHFVGDSSSGKSFLCLTCLAEAAASREFDGYDLYFDDAENGAGFDFEKFFGRRMAARVKPPAGTPATPVYSVSVEDFYDHLFTALGRGKPCVYVLDSMDVLTPEADHRKADQQRKARQRRKAGEAVKDEPGSYGMAKAKLNSTNLRVAVSKLKETGSVLVIVGQTRDKLQTMPGFGDNKTSGGGHALSFYASLILWSKVKEHLKKPVNGRDRELGIVSQVRVKKNRQTGRDRRVDIPIYHSAGLDDTGGMVDFLVAEGHWKKGDGGINAVEFGVKGNREKVVQAVEGGGKVKELRLLTKKVWNDIEAQCAVRRKPRYT